MRQKKFLEAETMYRETITRFQDNVVPRCGLAEVMRHQGRLAEAEEMYREIIAKSPDIDDVARGGLAAVLQDEGKIGEAESLYRNLIARSPSNIRPRRELAQF